MIVRSEGCKFMECGNCKFQFCWLCLSEFYTEYHYYYSSCPLRIVPIYGMVAFCFLFLLIKLLYVSPILSYYLSLVVGIIVPQILSSAITIMSVSAFKKYRQYRSERDIYEA